MEPLADRVRPITIEDVFGQEHLLSKGKILNRIITSGYIPNLIFHGPSGTGKTTVANIMAQMTNKRFYKLNATNASVKDIQAIIRELDSFLTVNGVLLYLDEIQNFNKKQQQSLLEYIENGKITLIASTTENPHFYVYNAILSRATVVEFKYLNKKNIIDGLKRAIKIAEEANDEQKIKYDNDVLDYIAQISGGDLRKAINAIDIAIYSTIPDKDNTIRIDIDTIKECTGEKALNYDRSGDSHYDILSAFQKSIRGSDPDAALHYLARLVKAGDLISICRRLLVMASEDIGLAYPSAITTVKSCVDAAMQVGFPEARINLAHAVILLSTAPKSNSVIIGIDNAIYDIENEETGDIPLHLKDSHYEGAKKTGRGRDYLYPHNYKNNYIAQQYLPDNIKYKEYYYPGQNKTEQIIKEHMEKIKKNE